ncbi:MAG: phosphohydrolase [Clostridia bacterium]|jgi:HD-GYP domain-containing protein (c-di-GMP phosphodiesterase class II)|nr:phosphohydrolase [Clostridia bacterium]
MTNKLRINIFDLLMCFSDALDLISPLVTGHQIRVAYISLKLAQEYKLPKEQIKKLVIAACIHDIGATTVKERNEIIKADFESDGRHEKVGSKYIEGSIFHDVSKIVGHHHKKWNNGLGAAVKGEEIPIECHLLHLADRIDTLIDKESYVLHQRKNITEEIIQKSGEWFMPELVEAFVKLSVNESFWLYTVSKNVSKILRKDAKLSKVYLNTDELYEVTKWFSNIIDFRSRFTSVHSRGVSASAGAIATVMRMDEDYIKIMEISGFIHDLGKLAVSNTILEKNGKLTVEEYNIIKSHTFHTYNVLSRIKSLKTISEYGSYHHEKLDGTGYPFHIKGRSMKLGSRILAVADIFTAIAEDRPYRVAMSKDEVIRLISSKGDDKALDSKIVKVFLENYDVIDETRKKAQSIASQEYEKFWQEV